MTTHISLSLGLQYAMEVRLTHALSKSRPMERTEKNWRVSERVKGFLSFLKSKKDKKNILTYSSAYGGLLCCRRRATSKRELLFTHYLFISLTLSPSLPSSIPPSSLFQPLGNFPVNTRWGSCKALLHWSVYVQLVH